MNNDASAEANSQEADTSNSVETQPLQDTGNGDIERLSLEEEGNNGDIVTDNGDEGGSV